MLSADYQQRRQQLFQQLPDHSIAILPAANKIKRNADSNFLFRQNSDFYYLTGFDEPNALAVFIKEDQLQQFILFSHPDDPELTIWEGARIGQERTKSIYGADAAFAITDLAAKLPDLLAGKQTLYYPLGREHAVQNLLLNLLHEARLKSRSAAKLPQQWHNLDTLVHELRLFKSNDEIKCIQHAVDVTVKGFHRVLRYCQPGQYEYQITAELVHEFHQAACQTMGYNAIVAGGDNACVLHYDRNNQRLSDGDLLLIDAGAEYQYYTADITRTFPVNGRFSKEQQAVYELVLASQLAGIEACQVNQPWPSIQTAIVKVISQGLLDLGLLKGSLDSIIETRAYAKFYMHNAGHWLGLDVHDAGSYKVDNQARLLAANMVLTVEPGIYITPGTPGIDEKWCGIGVRIEDDVLIEAQGPKVLSQALVKQVDDVQAMMKG